MSQHDRYHPLPSIGLLDMTLRDVFAAAALQGILQSSLLSHCQTGGKTDQDKVAKNAYLLATAMLTARE